MGVGSDEAQEGDIRRFFATVLSSLHTHTSRWSRQRPAPPHATGPQRPQSHPQVTSRGLMGGREVRGLGREVWGGLVARPDAAHAALSQCCWDAPRFVLLGSTHALPGRGGFLYKRCLRVCCLRAHWPRHQHVLLL